MIKDIKTYTAKPLNDYTLEEYFGFSKSRKLEAIKKLIDSISDDKVYDARAFYETEKETNNAKVEYKRLVEIDNKPFNEVTEEERVERRLILDKLQRKLFED